jgi:hypothetical protein
MSCSSFPDSSKDFDGSSIKIHGHWVIDILNEDNSIINSIEFDNSLKNPGKNFITSFLMGDNIAIDSEKWKINFILQNKPSENIYFQCEEHSISELPLHDNHGVLANLTRTQSETGGLNLSATCTVGVSKSTLTEDQIKGAQESTKLLSVETSLQAKSGLIIPIYRETNKETLGAQWEFLKAGSFTSKKLLTPIDVISGQKIAANVMITFD